LRKKKKVYQSYRSINLFQRRKRSRKRFFLEKNVKKEKSFSKKEVERAYAEYIPRYASMLTHAVELDANYSKKLEEQLISPNEKRYTTMLHRIKRHAGEVLEFLHANALFLSEKDQPRVV
jgi:hypothetical protein